jgi:hypothetical protein
MSVDDPSRPRPELPVTGHSNISSRSVGDMLVVSAHVADLGGVRVLDVRQSGRADQVDLAASATSVRSRTRRSLSSGGGAEQVDLEGLLRGISAHACYAMRAALADAADAELDVPQASVTPADSGAGCSVVGRDLLAWSSAEGLTVHHPPWPVRQAVPAVWLAVGV